MPPFAEIGSTIYPKEHAGNPVQPMEGKSLVPVFKAGSLDPRTMFKEHEGNRAVSAGNWKIVALHGKAWELYDMGRDRTETIDLSRNNPDKAAELLAEWTRWAARAKMLS